MVRLGQVAVIHKHSIQCPACDSLWVRHRARDNSFICRHCGEVWAKPKPKKTRRKKSKKGKV